MQSYKIGHATIERMGNGQWLAYGQSPISGPCHRVALTEAEVVAWAGELNQLWEAVAK